MFSFHTTDDEKRRKKLKGHIKLLFDYINYAVENIEELDDMTETVIDLGTRHFYYGVDPAYYLVSTCWNLCTTSTCAKLLGG